MLLTEIVIYIQMVIQTLAHLHRCKTYQRKPPITYHKTQPAINHEHVSLSLHNYLHIYPKDPAFPTSIQCGNKTKYAIAACAAGFVQCASDLDVVYRMIVEV